MLNSETEFLFYLEIGIKLFHFHPALTASEKSKKNNNKNSHIIKRWIHLLERREVMRTLPVCSIHAQELPFFLYSSFLKVTIFHD